MAWIDFTLKKKRKWTRTSYIFMRRGGQSSREEFKKTTPKFCHRQPVRLEESTPICATTNGDIEDVLKLSVGW